MNMNKLVTENVMRIISEMKHKPIK